MRRPLGKRHCLKTRQSVLFLSLLLVQFGVENFLLVHHALDGRSKGLLNHLVTHARNRFLQVLP
jgi:hypothetical protein